MEVQLAPELEKELNDLATQSGRGCDELIQDAVAGYVSEMGETRDLLNNRYDDIKSGRAKLIPGNEVFARLREKSAARKAKLGS